MTTLTHTSFPLFDRVLTGLSAVRAFCESAGRAVQANAEYQRLSGMSDAALAREGLRRDDIVDHVARIALGRPPACRK